MSRKYYDAHIIKLSNIIKDCVDADEIPKIRDQPQFHGVDKLKVACTLQDKGDAIRAEKGADFLVRKAFKEFEKHRDSSEAGKKKVAFILDSIKHLEELNLLRRLYGSSFRLVSVHCSKKHRTNRLKGALESGAKFA